MSTLIQVYQQKVERFNTNEFLGFYPVTISPVTDRATMKFAKELKEVSEGDIFKSSRFLLSASEMAAAIKNFLTKENVKASPTFTKEIKVLYKEHQDESENKRHYKAIAEIVFANEFRNRGWMIGIHECSIEVGDFVPYEPKKKPSFDDIQDLQALEK